MSKRKSPAEKDALAKEVTRLSNRWLEANRGNPEFQPEHYATKKNPFGDKEKANVAFGKALKKIETDLCKERGLVYSKYEDGEYMLEAPKSLIELYGKGVGGHRGVAHPKTKKQIHDYFQQWYKKNRKSVLRRMEKQRLAGGNGFAEEKEGENPIPSHQDLVDLYAILLPLYTAGNFEGMNQASTLFDNAHGIDDDLRQYWRTQDEDDEQVYGDLFQLVSDAEELRRRNFVPPEALADLDAGVMTDIVEGSSISDVPEDFEGIDLDFDADDVADIINQNTRGYPEEKEASGYCGGANGDSDEGETDSEDSSSDEEDNPLAHPHFWDGHQWVPIVPNPPPANLMEDDEIIEGNGYYRMKDGCSLYTGGSIQPVNYSSELKSNSWLGYGRRGHVMPVNHSAELTRSFNNY
jgi:hypothetical protein